MNPEWALANHGRVEEFRRRHRVGLVTLLFTDIIGSTKLKQTLGDAQAVAFLQSHHSAVSGQCPFRVHGSGLTGKSVAAKQFKRPEPHLTIEGSVPT